MVDPTLGPIALCTVCIHGRSSTIWITDPADGSPPLPLSRRREKLAEALVRCEQDGVDPEIIAADKQILQALDEFIAFHGDLFAEDGTPLAGNSSPSPGQATT